jgi:hypothetical protein
VQWARASGRSARVAASSVVLFLGFALELGAWRRGDLVACPLAGAWMLWGIGEGMVAVAWLWPGVVGCWWDSRADGCGWALVPAAEVRTVCRVCWRRDAWCFCGEAW